MTGKIISCIGGIYTVYCEGKQYLCYAKGSFRHHDICPVTGDEVEFSIGIGTDSSDRRKKNSSRSEDGYITSVLARSNLLPRPPLSNIDRLFIICSVTMPEPNLLSIDKLTAIADNLDIEPVLIFNKSELDAKKSEELTGLYSSCGFSVKAITASSKESLRDEFYPLLRGKTSAFEGPSGVGKTTLMNNLFSSLKLTTGAISEKNRRGKNTTRDSILYRLDDCDAYFNGSNSFLADTPGFTYLDFEHYPYMKKEELCFAFREFREHIGSCKYTKCTHLCEDGCKIVKSVENGNIPKSRHESYIYLYHSLSKQKPYKQKDWSNK